MFSVKYAVFITYCAATRFASDVDNSHAESGAPRSRGVRPLLMRTKMATVSINVGCVDRAPGGRCGELMWVGRQVVFNWDR